MNKYGTVLIGLTLLAGALAGQDPEVPIPVERRIIFSGPMNDVVGIDRPVADGEGALNWKKDLPPGWQNKRVKNKKLIDKSLTNFETLDLQDRICVNRAKRKIAQSRQYTDLVLRYDIQFAALLAALGEGTP